MPLWVACAVAVSSGTPRAVLSQFSYADVHITRGPLFSQAEFAKKYYLDLNEDSLLQGFRLRAGLPAPGKPMGGWYDPDGFAAAHPFGQYISALARMYAATGDPQYRAKVNRLVHGFAVAIRPDGYFFASEKVAREWPCYIYDKMCIAMRDAYTLTGNTEALAALRRMTDYAYLNLPRRSDEWYTLPENLYKCYELTHDPRYLRMAAEYDYSDQYYNVFARGENAFTPQRHAYSHVNSLSSSAKGYEFTGDPRLLRATQNAWSFLTTTQMYASGGWGPDERFVESGKGKLGESLTTSAKSFETPCGAYANVNLDRYLLRFTGEAKYGDNMERVLLNGMLASLPPEPDGRSFYYSNYQPGAKKEFFGDTWPCCNGTFAEVTADYPLDVYFHADRKLYVNLFVDSTVRWKLGSETVELKQTTQAPTLASTQFSLRLQRPQRFELEVRVPSWSTGSPKVVLNGKPYEAQKTDDGKIALNRVWRRGDKLQVTFPRKLRFEPIDSSNPKTCALMWGPLLMVALTDKDLSIVGDADNPANWIHPLLGSSTDLVALNGQTFRPLYLVKGEHYTTYLHLK